MYTRCKVVFWRKCGRFWQKFAKTARHVTLWNVIKETDRTKSGMDTGCIHFRFYIQEAGPSVTNLDQYLIVKRKSGTVWTIHIRQDFVINSIYYAFSWIMFVEWAKLTFSISLISISTITTLLLHESRSHKEE